MSAASVMRPLARALYFLVLSGFCLCIKLTCAFSEETGSRYIRHSENAKSVIIFVHGVVGSSISTWTNGTTHAYWPDLLTKDPEFEGVDIYVYEYPSSAMNIGFSIDEVADNMRLQLESDGVTKYENINFLAHSMGGLVTRAYLLKYRSVAAKVGLIYFYSTPTSGSQIGLIASLLSRNPQFGKMIPLKSEDYLGDLQRQWLAADFNIPSYCAYERQETYGVLIVGQSSAASLCTKHLDPINENHLMIVKPSGPRANSYLLTCFFKSPKLSG